MALGLYGRGWQPFTFGSIQFRPSEFLINRIAYFAGDRDKHVVPIVWQYRVQGATRRPTTVKTRYALPDTYTFALACVCKYDDKGEDPSLLIALEKALEDAVVAHSKQIQITSGPTVDFQTGSLNSYTITWRLEVDAR